MTKKNGTIEINLNSPIAYGDGKLNKFTIRNPTAGDLRGILLINLIQGDTDAIITILPRLSMPIITAQQAATISFADITEIFKGLSGFLEI